MSLWQWVRFLFSLDYRRPPEPKPDDRPPGNGRADASRDYWLTYRGCPIVYGRAPGFTAPDGPCFYCGEDHHHKRRSSATTPEETK